MALAVRRAMPVPKVRKNKTPDRIFIAIKFLFNTQIQYIFIGQKYTCNTRKMRTIRYTRRRISKNTIHENCNIYNAILHQIF